MITSISTKSGIFMNFVIAQPVATLQTSKQSESAQPSNARKLKGIFPAGLIARSLIPIGLTLLSACAQLPKGAEGTEKTGAGAEPSKPVAASASVTSPTSNPKPVTSGPPITPAGLADAAKNAAAALAAAVTPNPLRTFADVTKGAKVSSGFIPVWQKEDKVWIELKPEQFNQPMLFATQRSTGIGERVLYPHWMLVNHVVEFRRFGVNNAQVQFVAKNYSFGATNNPALQRVAEASFSDSLLGSTSVVSQAHPDRKTVLIEINPLLLTDVPQLSVTTEAYFRVGYNFDGRNSYIGAVSSSTDQVIIEVKAHYYVPRVPSPANLAAGGMPGPRPPRNLEDPRSFFVTYNYSFASMPAQVMAPRAADDRLGHFVETSYDFGNETETKQRRYAIHRWRLEKKDPAAAMSEPVKPITYWLDKNIPARYMASVKAGVLEWNKAFEKIGFKNAVRVEIEPDSGGPNLAGLRHASIRWFLDTDPGALAIGPSIVDPRSGEILDADIGISNNWTRLLREVITERSPNPSASTARLAASETEHTHSQPDSQASDAQRVAHLRSWMGKAHNHALCDYGAHASSDLQFAGQLLAARGIVDPDSPEVERIVQAVLKDVVMHEVGHTLGLRHNFRASTIYPLAKLRDKAFTAANGISGSVMDYNGFNTPLESEPYSDFVMTTLGPYDYWAIEYAYKPMNPRSETAELAAIASRSNEPSLAYGTDDEAGIGYDPDVNLRDLGDDPLAYAKRRLALAKELWARTQARTLKPGENYSILKRSSDVAFAQVDQAVEFASKYVGGVNYFRDHSGSVRAPYRPVPAARQREALSLLTKSILAEDSLKFDPAFVSRLVDDGLGRDGAPQFLPAISQNIAAIQRRVLDRLMSAGVATRLLEIQTQVSDKSQTLPLAEVYATIQTAVWSELVTGSDIGVVRRALQRDHLRKLTSLLLTPSFSTPLDSRSLARLYAQRLAVDLRKANAKFGGVGSTSDKPNGKLSTEARAHLSESLVALDDALKSPLIRSGS